jgi:NAD(P)-dependent dehydrogenase (short-subunit alcohol dehydrogenase family)
MSNGHVLVTGASSGIGLAIACDLRSRGVPVIAGVRGSQAGERVRDVAPGTVTIDLDITHADHVAALPGLVERLAGGQLAAVVNNAGHAVAGPLECVPLADWRRQFEVNVLGQVAVTQALLPQLRRSGGRVLFIGSIAGRVASPFAGPYCASKFALRALADSLRVELLDQGVRVVLIEPGAFRSRIWEKTGSATRDLANAHAPNSAVGRLYHPLLAACHGLLSDLERRAPSPEPVARTVWRALTARQPRARYLVGADAWLAAFTLALLPDGLRDRLYLSRLRSALRGTRAGH